MKFYVILSILLLGTFKCPKQNTHYIYKFDMISAFVGPGNIIHGLPSKILFARNFYIARIHFGFIGWFKIHFKPTNKTL